MVRKYIGTYKDTDDETYKAIIEESIVLGNSSFAIYCDVVYNDNSGHRVMNKLFSTSLKGAKQLLTRNFGIPSNKFKWQIEK